MSVNCDTILEAKAYNEDSTSEEIAAIKASVFLYEDNIIYFKELEIITPFTINLMFDEVEKYKDPEKPRGLVIDLTKNKVPDAKSRRVINNRFSYLNRDIAHVSFVTGKNLLVNSVIKFVVFKSNLNSYSVSTRLEDGIAHIKKHINV